MLPAVRGLSFCPEGQDFCPLVRSGSCYGSGMPDFEVARRMAADGIAPRSEPAGRIEAGPQPALDGRRVPPDENGRGRFGVSTDEAPVHA
jgi:hypothetical protein